MLKGKYEIKMVIPETHDLKLVGYFLYEGIETLAVELSGWCETHSILCEGAAITQSINEDWAFTMHTTDNTVYLAEWCEEYTYNSEWAYYSSMLNRETPWWEAAIYFGLYDCLRFLITQLYPHWSVEMYGEDLIQFFGEW